MWGLKFSWRWVWRLLSSGKWRRVVWFKGTNVSDELAEWNSLTAEAKEKGAGICCSPKILYTGLSLIRQHDMKFRGVWYFQLLIFPVLHMSLIHLSFFRKCRTHELRNSTSTWDVQCTAANSDLLYSRRPLSPAPCIATVGRDLLAPSFCFY
jgi:hypothetical protein